MGFQLSSTIYLRPWFSKVLAVTLMGVIDSSHFWSEVIPEPP